MKSPITYDNLRKFAYSNDKLIEGEVKGIILDFTGLGTQNMRAEELDVHIQQAKRGMINIRPYYNPWCWMNRQTVRFVDEIVDVIIEHYNLSEDIPIVSSGVSMGGLCSLVYTCYAKRTPIRCVSHCPVCNLLYHLDEREDIPRTLHSAFGSYEEMTFEDALKTASPLHLIDKMPYIPYTLFHSKADALVNIDVHSRELVKVMKEQGHDIVLYEVDDCVHGDLTEEMWKKYRDCVMLSMN